MILIVCYPTSSGNCGPPILTAPHHVRDANLIHGCPILRHAILAPTTSTLLTNLERDTQTAFTSSSVLASFLTTLYTTYLVHNLDCPLHSAPLCFADISHCLQSQHYPNRVHIPRLVCHRPCDHCASRTLRHSVLHVATGDSPRH